MWLEQTKKTRVLSPPDCHISSEELFTISHWLEQNLKFEYAIIYSAERGKLVLRSLLSSSFKNNQKRSSWGNEPLNLLSEPHTKFGGCASQSVSQNSVKRQFFKETGTTRKLHVRRLNSHIDPYVLPSEPQMGPLSISKRVQRSPQSLRDVFRSNDRGTSNTCLPQFEDRILQGLAYRRPSDPHVGLATRQHDSRHIRVDWQCLRLVLTTPCPQVCSFISQVELYTLPSDAQTGPSLGALLQSTGHDSRIALVLLQGPT
uniref:Uncharacterized protein n=1 Tax=Glossina pallidipes TaxID=7398 RepID=A0A1A9ZRX8_GLOPL